MSATPEEVIASAAPPEMQAPALPEHIPFNFRNTAGRGRKPGATNLTTRQAKQVAAMLADREANAFRKWIHKVAETKPERACELYLDLLKIILPTRLPSASMAATFTSPDGAQSAVGMKVRGLFGLPEPMQQSAPE